MTSFLLKSRLIVSLTAFTARSLGRASGVRQSTSIQASRALRTQSLCRASFSGNDPSAKAQQLFDQGLQKWNTDDVQGALECYQQSIWTAATGDAYYNIANCYLQLGKHQSAVDAWKKSLELSPGRADAHVNLANVYALILKRHDEALAHYENALNLEPKDGQIHYNFAVVLDSMGNLDKAIEHYKIAVENGTTVAQKNLRNAMARKLGQQLKEEPK
ncbi:uncharacterized protein EV422DRAFT_126312 [Fimicolochytrium jonesii]|uniref:uncharacterized protein n=1 Tax=Fimicolochytrium jonesii TaxID=1396493 RepID=UPI0022FF1B36|nr:uncharacterized protein EV422DRAFT_126312 [Fimicolochytrium jonesii]KAI8818948.1 hypothetical protein EV422DRAFT_126312 [Fimicolochytrium jonesii]